MNPINLLRRSIPVLFSLALATSVTACKKSGSEGHSGHGSHAAKRAPLVIDPVTADAIKMKDAVGKLKREGRTWFFSSKDSMKKFKKEPAKYIKGYAKISRLVYDPVCGMRFSVAKSKGHVKHDGHEVHFCSAMCKRAFKNNPKKYAAKMKTYMKKHKTDEKKAHEGHMKKTDEKKAHEGHMKKTDKKKAHEGHMKKTDKKKAHEGHMKKKRGGHNMKGHK